MLVVFTCLLCCCITPSCHLTSCLLNLLLFCVYYHHPLRINIKEWLSDVILLLCIMLVLAHPMRYIRLQHDSWGKKKHKHEIEIRVVSPSMTHNRQYIFFEKF